MATTTATWQLAMENGVSEPAESAEDSLKALQSQIDKDSKALTQMKKAMRQMQAAGSVDIEAYRKLKSEIDATQDSIGKARAQFVNLGGDFSKIGKKAKREKIAPKIDPPKGFDALLASADKLPGPLAAIVKGVGGVRAKIIKMSAAMGFTLATVVATVAALAALAAILAVVTAATAKATAALLKYAAAQADAMRSERLRLAGLGTLRRWMRLTDKDASQMSESINRVSETVPLARSQVQGYGQELHRLGIRGRAAESALEALSIAQAVQGDLGRRRLMMLVRQAGHSEQAMADLAARVRKELGGNAAMQMRALGMISTKLRESFQSLFTGVNIEPLLTGLQRITRLLSQTTESGRALRAIMSTVLSVFIGELADTAPRLEYFLKELVILALKVAIKFFQIKNAIESAFGGRILGRFMAVAGSAEVIKIALIAVGIVVAVLAVNVMALVFVLAGLAAPLIVVGAAIYYAYQAVQDLLAAWPSLFVLFAPEIWVQAGSSMIDGIVAGIMSGAARVQSAMTGIATTALGAFRGALGIHSPSAAFAELGVAIPQGVAEGVGQGQSEATGAAENMMSTTTNTASTTTGGSSRAVTTGEIHIHIEGGEGAEDTAQRVTDALRDFFDTGMAMETV